MFSPCIYNSVLKSVATPCSSADYPLCSEDPREHAVAYASKSQKRIVPIGIAKDGHPIYGPFNSVGSLW